MSFTDSEVEGILKRAETVGATMAMHKPTTVRAVFDVDAVSLSGDEVIGMTEEMIRVRREHPYLFKPGAPMRPPVQHTFDPDKPIVDQVRAIVARQEVQRVDDFLATKPDANRLLHAVKTGDLSC